MKIKKNIIAMIFVCSILFTGCNMNKDIGENEIPYIGDENEEIDNGVINERYVKVDKQKLTYDEFKYSGENTNQVEVHLANSIKNDISYKDILLGFTYTSEENPTKISYEEALKLIKKVLPDDIEKVKSILDKEVSKEYIYYKSDKGNFRVGLSYGEDFNDKSIKEIHKDSIAGIDYSKEIVQ